MPADSILNLAHLLIVFGVPIAGTAFTAGLFRGLGVDDLRASIGAALLMIAILAGYLWVSGRGWSSAACPGAFAVITANVDAAVQRRRRRQAMESTRSQESPRQ
jgi:hypothetical protein